MSNCWVRTPSGFLAAFPEDETSAGFLLAAGFGAPMTGSSSSASSTLSTITATPGAVVADGSSTSSISITLRDANNNIISGKSVHLVQSGKAIVTPSTQSTNASGSATFTASDSVTEVVTFQGIDSTDNVTLNTTVQVSYTASSGGGTIPFIAGNVLSLQDQSFETVGSIGTWRIDTGAGGIGTLSRVTTPVNDGVGALQAVLTNANSPVATGVSQYAVTASHSYLATAFVQSISTADSVLMGLQWYDTNGVFISNSFSATQTVPASSFGSITFTATSPANAGFIVLFLSFVGAKTYVIDTVSLLDKGVVTGGTTSATQATTIYDSFGTTNPDTGFVAGVRTDLPSGGILFDANHQWGKHEYPIFLNPGYDWSQGARYGGVGPVVPSQNSGNSPTINGCHTQWGQAFDAVTAPGSTSAISNNNGVRIQVANWTLWVVEAASLPGSGAIWTKWWTVPVLGGGLYDTNFSGAAVGFGAIRTESSGGWSFAYTPGFINHFWDNTFPRHGWPGPGSLAAIHTRFQARLISDNSSINLNNIFITVGGACDFYGTPSVSAGGSAEAGMMISRQKRLLTSWQWFTATGMDLSQMQSNQVPVFGS